MQKKMEILNTLPDGVFMEIQKIIYEHLWLIDGHF